MHFYKTSDWKKSINYLQLRASVWAMEIHIERWMVEGNEVLTPVKVKFMILPIMSLKGTIIRNEHGMEHETQEHA